ncbi:MAG TPA: nucleotidyltransferase family protein [Candidatus Paceibacterota bacterium]
MEVTEISKKVSPILREHGVIKASVFGSVSRGDSNPMSDVDILISLGKPMGMFAYMGLIHQMEDSLGRKVDLVTEKSLSKFVRPYVIPDLKVIYEG